MFRRSLIIALLLLTGGCHATPSENLPTYAWTDDATAVRTLCDRASKVQTLSAECALTLTRTGGDSVRLDGAIAMRLPDSVRMRAWKFGQAVFDLTMTPEGLWVEAPPDPDRRGQVMPASVSAAKMARAWSILSGDFFCAPDVRIDDRGGPCFRVERIIDGQRIVCDVQRATLTPRQYAVYDLAGVERFTLMVNRYEMIQGILWPVQLTAHSDGGVIEIELKDPELNGELAPSAFVPPKRAEKMP